MNLKTAIKTKNIAQIRQIVKTTTFADIANILQEMPSADCVVFFRLLKTNTQSDIFAFLDPEHQERLIKAFTDKELKEIVGDLWADDLVELLEEVPSEISSRILKSIDNETRSNINLILRYSEEQIGSFMSPNVGMINQNWDVGQTRDYLRDYHNDIIMEQYFYVVDSKSKPIGYVSIQDLILKTRDFKIKKLIKPIITIKTTMNKEIAARIFGDHKMPSIPVVNSQGILVGMITSDDVIDIIQESATEDMRKMAGIGYDHDKPYLNTSVWEMVKSRFWWLLLLLFSATLSQIVLQLFQSISTNSIIYQIQGATLTSLIVAIVPVISGAAGNAGSQSSTMVIRALAMGEITTKDYWKVFHKELKVSTIIATFLAFTNFARLVIYYLIVYNFVNIEINLIVSFGASLALFIVVIFSKLIGGVLPIVAKKLKLDPATMAAPILTTILDAFSIMILFGTIITLVLLL